MRKQLNLLTQGHGDGLVDAYRKLSPTKSATYLLTDILTDLNMWSNSIKLAQCKIGQGGAPVFMYRLDWETPVLEDMLRTTHGLDLPLMFDNVALAAGLVGTGPEPQQVADKMAQAWVNFARTGDPIQPQLAWKPYSDDRQTMIFDVVSHLVSDPRRARREIMAQVGTAR